MRRILLKTVVSLLIVIMSFNFVSVTHETAALTAKAWSAGEERLAEAVVLYVGSHEAYVNNERKMIDNSNPDIKPIIKNNRTLVPLRFVSESLGARVEWYGETKTVKLLLGNHSVVLQVNSKIMKLNQQELILDVEPEIIQDRVFVPIRAVTEAFGKKVFYDRKLIIISDKDNIFDKEQEKGYIDNIIRRFTGNDIVERELSISEIAALGRSVVMVVVLDKLGNPITQGSGFCVGKGLFLTNYHVVKNMAGGYIVTEEQEKYDIEGIVKSDLKLDLAIIKTRTPVEIEPLKIGSKDSVKKGDRIVTIGSPEGFQNTVSDGIVSGFRQIDGVDLVQITAPITHGSSGGPLFNMQGHVIGITASGFQTGNLNFAVATDHAVTWIDELNRMEFSEIQIMRADYKGVPSDQEIMNVIYANMKAMEDEDVEAYMDTIYVPSPEKAEAQRNALILLFRMYDFDVEMMDYEIVEKENDSATVKTTHKICTSKDGVKIESVQVSRHTLQIIGDKWRITETVVIRNEIVFTEADSTEATPVSPKPEVEAYDIHVSSVTENSAHISWKTSMATVAKIEYGANDSYGNMVDVSTKPTTEHSVILDNLKAATKYHYRLHLKREDGTFKVTGDLTFTTMGASLDVEEIDVSDMTVTGSISLNSPLDKIVYSGELNKAYGIDRQNKKLVVIDLAHGKIEKEIQLAYKPSDLCIAADRKKMFIVNEGSSFISQMNLADYKVTKNISWKAPHFHREYHYHIYYKDKYLYIVDGQWSPGLWRINLDNYQVEDFTGQVTSIGDIVFDEGGKQLYYWHQYGWTAGWAGSKVYKYSVEDDKFTLVDETEIGYPDMRRDPLDTPIILIEDKNLLICKQYLFNMNNLKEVHYTFPEEIYAVDPTCRYAVGKKSIYGLKYYNKLRATPKQNADQYFFDKKGKLYMLVNSDKKLYIAEVNN